MKINEAINKARSLLKQNNIDDANLQAKILIQYILKESQSYVIANGEKELDEYELNEYMLYINKIVNGLPIQYITNKQEFMKLNFYVDENVLIPQPDTEILVEEVIKNCNLYSDKNGVKHIRIQARPNKWHENDCPFCHKSCPVYDKHSSSIMPRYYEDNS